MPRPASKLAAKVYDGILLSILVGEFSPGKPLPEEQLSAKYGVSRSTIREAFSGLDADGLVDWKLKGRSHVRLNPQPEEIMQSQELRFYCESLAGCELIERLEKGTASLDEIEHLHKEMVDLKNKTPFPSRQQKAEFLLKDFAFHLAIPRLAGCLPIILPLNRLLLSVRIHSLPIYMQHEQLDVVVGEHEEILSALQSHDPALFVEKTREHLDQATMRWLSGEEARKPITRRLSVLWKAAPQSEPEQSPSKPPTKRKQK